MTEKQIRETGYYLTGCALQSERFSDVKNFYHDISIYVEQILNEIFGPTYDFPIRIDIITEALGAKLVLQPVNIAGDQYQKVSGILLKRKNMFTGEKSTQILIDEDANRANKRYTAAFLLGMMLMHQKEDAYSTEYQILPLKMSAEQLVAEQFATFLLMPPTLLAQELKEFAAIAPDITQQEWLRYLSVRAEVEYERAVIGCMNMQIAGVK